MRFSINRIHELASEISKRKWALLENRPSNREFNAYPNILCIFQTFNKAHLIRLVLRPFVAKRFRNIMLFADGCMDTTLTKTHAILKGKNHAVIAVNDLHEIHNYRFAVTSEWAKRCEFALLMQDDDLYSNDFSWLDFGLEMMKQDPKLVVIGFNGGINYLQIAKASETFESDEFVMKSNLVGLTNNWVGELLQGRPNNLFFQYCQTVNRAPHLIRLNEFNSVSGFDSAFEPYHDDDMNYCFDLWRKGYRVGYISGAQISRDIGTGGMRLSGNVGINKRPTHLKRNHTLLFSRYGDFINSGELATLVSVANKTLECKN